MTSKKIPIMLFILCLAFLVSCIKKVATPSSENSPGLNEVWMKNIAFSPSSITVSVNATVTWTNKDNMDHNVTSVNSGSFQSGTMGTGAKFSHQFSIAGTYNYTCTFHQGMNGIVIVK